MRHSCDRGPLVLLVIALGAACRGSRNEPTSSGPSEREAAEPPRTAELAPRTGRWRKLAREQPLTAEQREQAKELERLGYASGSRPAANETGVTVHVVGRAFEGWNFYTSGHTSGAALMDMDGRVLHTWNAAVEEVWPELEERGENFGLTRFWRRAFLCDDGAVVAIFEGYGVAKLDKDSRVLWKHRCGAHHDLQLLPDGDLFVLTREVCIDPRRGEEPFLEDFVTLLGSDGEEKRSVSVLESLERSAYRELAAEALKRRGDPLHTNSLVVLDGRFAALVPAFERGNLLLSSRPSSFVCVLDPRRAEIVWLLQGSFREQHDPKLLDDGHLLLFDNGGERRASAVLELDPATGATIWEYRGSPDAPFHSATCGTAERLPNGDTLITESDQGRAFEVTPAGEIVWEFRNPARAGPANEYVATLFELIRLAPIRFDWLDGRDG